MQRPALSGVLLSVNTAICIPTELIEPASILLRNVDETAVEYMELRDSIARNGLLNSICVRPKGDRYEVVEGMHRYTACKYLGWKSIPCIVRQLSDKEVLYLQVTANATRPETKPAQYARRLHHIQNQFPDVTLGDLATMVGKSPEWVAGLLDLVFLTPEMQASVDRGEITLSNARLLSKIPFVHQTEFFDQARLMRTADFEKVVTPYLRNLMEQIRNDRLEAYYDPKTFKARYFLRDLDELRAEMVEKTNFARVVSEEGAETLADVWVACIRWVLHVDKASLEVQRENHQKRVREAIKRQLEIIKSKESEHQESENHE